MWAAPVPLQPTSHPGTRPSAGALPFVRRGRCWGQARAPAGPSGQGFSRAPCARPAVWPWAGDSMCVVQVLVQGHGSLRGRLCQCVCVCVRAPAAASPSPRSLSVLTCEMGRILGCCHGEMSGKAPTGGVAARGGHSAMADGTGSELRQGERVSWCPGQNVLENVSAGAQGWGGVLQVPHGLCPSSHGWVLAGRP